MHVDVIAPPENVVRLRQELAQHFGADAFLKCESMAALIREDMRQIRMEEAHGRPRVAGGSGLRRADFAAGAAGLALAGAALAALARAALFSGELYSLRRS